MVFFSILKFSQRNILDELELAKKGLLPNIALQLDGSQPVADEVYFCKLFSIGIFFFRLEGSY